MTFKDKLFSNSNLAKLAIKTLLGKAIKPNKQEARALLEYISWENSTVRETLEILAKRRIEKYFEWIDGYCKKYKCTQEQALVEIIAGAERI